MAEPPELPFMGTQSSKSSEPLGHFSATNASHKLSKVAESTPFGTVSSPFAPSPSLPPPAKARQLSASTFQQSASKHTGVKVAVSKHTGPKVAASMDTSKDTSAEHTASEHTPSEHTAFEKVVGDSTLNGLEKETSSASEQDVDDSIQQTGCTRKRKRKQNSKSSKKKGAKSSKNSKQNEGWPEDVEFDATDEVMTIDDQGKRVAVGGSIQPRDVDNEENRRFTVEFNEHNQPLGKGGSILVRFLGRMVKTDRFCPIGKDSWHKVSQQKKADIIQIVRSKFVLPTKKIIDKKALRRVAKTWRNYKYTLKKTYFNLEKRTKQQIYDDVPKGHTSSEWIDLVDYWCSKRFQKLSKFGKAARGSLNHLHTTGSTSFADIRAKYEKELGRKLSYIEFFDLTHETDDGESVDGTISREFLEAAKIKVDERAASSSKPRIQLENEVFKELMYDDNSKRPIGFGFGVNKSAVLGVHGELSERGFHYNDDEDHVEVDNMKAELENLTNPSKVLEEKNQALEKKNQELKKRNQELGATVQGHDEILKQLLISVRSGHLSDEFVKKTQSFLGKSGSEVHDVSSGNGTGNGSRDVTHSPGSTSWTKFRSRFKHRWKER